LAGTRYRDNRFLKIDHNTAERALCTVGPARQNQALRTGTAIVLRGLGAVGEMPA
jgi:hypothetical protein